MLVLGFLVSLLSLSCLVLALPEVQLVDTQERRLARRVEALVLELFYAIPQASFFVLFQPCTAFQTQLSEIFLEKQRLITFELVIDVLQLGLQANTVYERI